MALKFIDSFDHYGTNDFLEKWTDDGHFGPTIVAGAGRCGSQAMLVTVFNELSKGINFGSTTTVIGYALKTEAALQENMLLHAIGDSFGDHITLSRTSDGKLHVWRSAGLGGLTALLGSTSADVVRNDTYYFIEVKSTIDAAVGAVEVRVNNVVKLTLTGVNSFGANAVGATPTRVTFYGTGNETFYVDDFYALDSTGTDTTTYLGDVRAECLVTTAVGTYTDLSVVGATDAWDAVNDGAAPNDDTDYITTAAVNQKSTFNFSDTGLPAGSVLGVQINILARKTDSGPRGIKPVIRSGGSDFLGTEQNPSATSYSYLHEAWGKNPVSAAAWDIATVNALEAGVKLTT